eukprot:jgi/Bigna1/85298/estExt_fgenesh1_pg.C_30173
MNLRTRGAKNFADQVMVKACNSGGNAICMALFAISFVTLLLNEKRPGASAEWHLLRERSSIGHEYPPTRYGQSLGSYGRISPAHGILSKRELRRGGIDRTRGKTGGGQLGFDFRGAKLRGLIEAMLEKPDGKEALNFLPNRELNSVLNELKLDKRRKYEGGAPGSGSAALLRWSPTLQLYIYGEILPDQFRSRRRGSSSKGSKDGDAIPLVESLHHAEARIFALGEGLLLFLLMASELVVYLRTPNCTRVWGKGLPLVKMRDVGGVTLSWDPTSLMFSHGNLSERRRIADLDCSGETVVDLFAGIGWSLNYHERMRNDEHQSIETNEHLADDISPRCASSTTYFTLHYLCNANASVVHACEINPNASHALKNNLRLNEHLFSGKCIVHTGDCRNAPTMEVADRVNLGLLPTAEDGFEAACRALKQKGGMLHIHGNAHVDAQSPQEKDIQRRKYARKLIAELREVLEDVKPGPRWQLTVMNITRVKSYAPRVEHVVVDVKVSQAAPTFGMKLRAIEYSVISLLAKALTVVSLAMYVRGIQRARYEEKMKDLLGITQTRRMSKIEKRRVEKLARERQETQDAILQASIQSIIEDAEQEVAAKGKK